MQSQLSQGAAALARLEKLQHYLQGDPGNITLLLDAIETALVAGALEQAERLSKDAAALYPDDTRVTAQRGHIMLERASYAEAADLFASINSASPHMTLAYNQAYALTRLARYQEAADVLLPYAEIAPPPVMVALLRALHHAGHANQAAELAAKAESRMAGDADFLSAASLAYIDTGDAPTALRMAQQALAGAHRPMEAVVASATLLLGEGDQTQASALFQEAVTRQPRDGRSWSGLGMASLMARDLPSAREHLTRALDFMPRHIGTWHALGWCYLFMGLLDQAKSAFDSALALDRNFGDSHGGLAVVAAFSGDRAAAQKSIDRALGLDPTSLSARYAQMALGGQLDDPERFQLLARKLLSTRQSPLGTNLAGMVDSHASR